MRVPWLLLARSAHLIDRVSEWTGRLSAWLILAMVLLISYDVSLRYLFNQSSVGLQELEWHLFALTFLLGIAYTFKHDEHVRVDIFYQSAWMTARHRAWVNLLGSLLFLLPFCLLVIESAWPFVHNAYLQGEGSPDSGGLPARWLLKAALPLGFGLLFLQGLSHIMHNLLFLLGDKASTQDKPV